MLGNLHFFFITGFYKIKLIFVFHSYFFFFWFLKYDDCPFQINDSPIKPRLLVIDEIVPVKKTQSKVAGAPVQLPLLPHNPTPDQFIEFQQTPQPQRAKQ